MKIYTRKGDDGTTGLLYGGRVAKDSPRIDANGVVDEAQAALGLARCEAEPDGELDQLLIRLERELYVLMAEVATDAANRHKLEAARTRVTPQMVAALESDIDRLTTRFEMPKEFVVPGNGRASAALDVARTIVRRAERLVGGLDLGAGSAGNPAGPASSVPAYLNRLSDLLWTMARWQEGEHLSSRTGKATR
ncbi:MAG: cob(I)yrinic acid a,c-diamide adenosyltransferase [Acidimicrobiales bacterium]